MLSRILSVIQFPLSLQPIQTVLSLSAATLIVNSKQRDLSVKTFFKANTSKNNVFSDPKKDEKAEIRRGTLEI